jgi:predicted ATPase
VSRPAHARLRWAVGLSVGVIGLVAAANDLIAEYPAIPIVGGAIVVLLMGWWIAPRVMEESHREAGESEPLGRVVPATATPVAEPQPRPLRCWLPGSDGDLIGRDEDVQRLTDLLAHQRLVTLLGPGGAGKTRLAVAVGERSDGRVSFVDLLRVEPGDSVLGALARQLDIELIPRVDDVDAVQLALLGDELLLIVDNCEHVRDEAAAVIDQLLDRCANVRVLATSRVALEGPYENRFDVEPLPTPPASADADEAAGSSAVRLFIERAQRVDPSFELTQATTPGVVRICRTVEGLPYALVLVAAALGEQRLKDVVDGVEDSLLEFRAGPGARHRETLASTIAWSVGLLGAEEQLVFRRIGVFTGSLTKDGAAAVTPELRPRRTSDALVSLCRASLIQLVPDQEVTRYRLLEVARAWARTTLDAQDPAEAQRAYRAHAEHVTAVVRGLAPRLRSKDRMEVLAALDTEYDDVAAALSWCGRHDRELGRRLAGALHAYWSFRGLLKEGSRRLDAALDGPPGTDALARAQVLCGAGTLAFIRGEFPLAVRRLREAVDICEALEAQAAPDAAEARGVRASALTVVGMSESSLGHHDDALQAVHESAETFEQAQDEWGLALALNDTGTVLRYAGHADAAVAAYERSLTMWNETGDPWGRALTLSNLAIVAVAQERPADARRYVSEALPLQAADGAGSALSELILAEIARLTGDAQTAQARYRESLRQHIAIDRRNVVAECLDRFGLFAAEQGASEAAAVLLGAADEYRDAHTMEISGAAFPTGPDDRERERRARLGAEVDSAPFAAAYERGRRLSPEDAAAQVDVGRGTVPELSAADRPRG